jgi:hypothetical protein
MRRVVWLIVGLGALAAGPALALFCHACGVELPERSKFCNSCGTPQKPAGSLPGTPRPAAPSAPVARSTPMAAPPSAPAHPSSLAGQSGRVGRSPSHEQFLRLMQPLLAHEPELRISKLTSPRVLPLVQRVLIPGWRTLKQDLDRRGVALTPVQSKIFSLFQDRYAAILSWATALGSERDCLFPRIGQLASLQGYLLAVPDDETIVAVEAITEVFNKEMQNVVARVDALNDKAGFENPGVAYQIKLGGSAPHTDHIPFSLLMGDSGRRTGDRMQVFDQGRTLLGRLEFVGEKDGIRRYRGLLSRRQLAALPSRQIWVEFVTKTMLSPSWKKEKLRLLLMQSLSARDAGECEYEALHGTTPDLPRMRYLQSLGSS